MKLFLMRHAEAEPAKDKSDFDRELTAKGRHEAAKAAEFLSNYLIDKVLVSPARRTWHTAEIILEKIKCHQYEILPKLYGSSAETIIKIIAEQDCMNRNLLVIAHNPGIFKAALELMDNNSGEYDELLHDGMTTAKIVILDFDNIKDGERDKKNF